MFERSVLSDAFELEVAEIPLSATGDEVAASGWLDVALVGAAEGAVLSLVGFDVGEAAVWLAANHHQIPPMTTTAMITHITIFALVDIS
jgi:hypothetical protein